MGVEMTATCSECYQTTDMIFATKQKEMVCPVCGHAVPSMDVEDMKNLQKEQAKKKVLSMVAMAVFGLAILLFGAFIMAAEPPAGEKFKDGLPGSATVMLALSIVSLLVSMGVSWVASNRSYICEF